MKLVYNIKEYFYIGRIKMSDLELNKSQEERDTLDGCFAVVDRERLIEEETREITPWDKHFIHVFTAPEKMLSLIHI